MGKRGAVLRTTRGSKRSKLDGEDSDDAGQNSSPDKGKTDDSLLEEVTNEQQGKTTAERKGTGRDEEDLNYDEYDLSEECDMVVTCKSCDTIFKSLEKFIAHKKTKCKSHRFSSKGAANSVAVDESSTKKNEGSPIKTPLAVRDEDEVGIQSLDENPTLEDVQAEPQRLIKPVSRVYSARRNRNTMQFTMQELDVSAVAPAIAPSVIEKQFLAAMASETSSIDITDRRKAATLPDEVVRISDGQTHEPEPKSRMVKVVKQPQVVVSDSDSDLDIDELVSVVVKPPQDDDSDPELPVEVKAVPIPPRRYSDYKGISQTLPKLAPATPPKTLTPYKIISVEENTKKIMSQPSLALSFDQLKKIKILNLVTPLPSPSRAQGADGRSPDRLVVEAMTDGSLLGQMQTVLATTKDGHSIKLKLRRVIKSVPTSALSSTSAPPSTSAAPSNSAAPSTSALPTTAAPPLTSTLAASAVSSEVEQIVETGKTEAITHSQEAAKEEVVEADGAGEIDPSSSSLQEMPESTEEKQESSETVAEIEESKEPILEPDDEDDSQLMMDPGDDPGDNLGDNLGDDPGEAEEAEDMKPIMEESDDNKAEFEHDPDLYDFLRDDEFYLLLPKQKMRLSRLEIKSRKDCDWLTRRCFRCNTLYSCLKTLINHMSYQHADKKAFFPCIYCRNIYSQQKNVSRHLQKTHYKSKDFVDKLRAFVRSQAFIRQLKNLDKDSEKLTEENDPFLRNLRRILPPSTPTRYAKMSDTEMLSKYGRKIKMIGRPPGRPSKSKSSNVSLTCTICSASISSVREMLRHLKEGHNYSQKKINKLRPKLVSRMSEVAVTEREKAVERDGLSTEQKNVLFKSCTLDRFGRLIINQATGPFISSSATTAIEQPMISAIQSQARLVTAPTTTAVRADASILELVQCPTCSRVFGGYESLGKHAATCFAMPKPPTIAPRPPAVQPMFEIKGAEQSSTQQQPVVFLNESESSKVASNQTYEEPDVYYKLIKAPGYEHASGLETLAMISTNEAKKTASPQATSAEHTQASAMSAVTTSTHQSISSEMPITITEDQLAQLRAQVSNVSPVPTSQTTIVQQPNSGHDSEQVQAVTITVDQLSQLKTGDENIIYVVKTASGGIERIEDPHGMEVVEISQISDIHNLPY